MQSFKEFFQSPTCSFELAEVYSQFELQENSNFFKELSGSLLHPRFFFLHGSSTVEITAVCKIGLLIRRALKQTSHHFGMDLFTFIPRKYALA